MSAGGLIRLRSKGRRKIQRRVGQFVRVAGADDDWAVRITLLQPPVAGNMVAVAVRDQDGRRLQTVLVQIRQDFVRLQTRIEHQTIVASLKVGNVGIFLKRGRDNAGYVNRGCWHGIDLSRHRTRKLDYAAFTFGFAAPRDPLGKQKRRAKAL